MPHGVVFDTNILISALLSSRGSPFRCLALARAGTFESITCQEILDEFEEKLRSKFGYLAPRAQLAVDEVLNFSRLVKITNTVRVVSADPEDDKVLECAVSGGATHIVTGGRRHLLPLESYQDIKIVSASDFLSLLDEPA